MNGAADNLFSRIYREPFWFARPQSSQQIGAMKLDRGKDYIDYCANCPRSPLSDRIFKST